MPCDTVKRPLREKNDKRSEEDNEREEMVHRLQDIKIEEGNRLVTMKIKVKEMRLLHPSVDLLITKNVDQEDSRGWKSRYSMSHCNEIKQIG